MKERARDRGRRRCEKGPGIPRRVRERSFHIVRRRLGFVGNCDDELEEKERRQWLWLCEEGDGPRIASHRMHVAAELIFESLPNSICHRPARMVLGDELIVFVAWIVTVPPEIFDHQHGLLCGGKQEGEEHSLLIGRFYLSSNPITKTLLRSLV
ncbi:uncharacterized protein [Physcomitrium patens]|uniref:uncharacterized protein isoform X4 n=1 Tax=Physcomitrium patens TaxID=3218 RepID=UPI003CCCAE9C